MPELKTQPGPIFRILHISVPYQNSYFAAVNFSRGVLRQSGLVKKTADLNATSAIEICTQEAR